jgi:hypothetical protein
LGTARNVYLLRNNMRTPLLAVVLGFSLAGCLVGDSGTASQPGGDDDTGPGSNPQGGSNTTPSADITIDRSTVMTELGKDEVVTLNVTGHGGFAGDVTVTPSLVDGAGVALTAGGLTVTGQTTLSVAANGNASAMYTVKIPTNASGTQLLANLKLDVSSSLGTKSLMSAFTVQPIFSVPYPAGLAGNVQAHPLRALKISVKQGAKISLHNADTTSHITHGDNGFPHENQDVTVGGLAGNTYVIDTAKLAVGTKGAVGCHTHGSATYATVTVE